jgi:prepilin-type N-terminal cleavage/methylation domain-containing protein
VKKQIQKGFTLIELLVVISIITIMTSVLFVMMSNDKEKRLVRTAAEGFIASVRDAQNIALTGQSVQGKRPCGVTVSVATKNYSYAVEAYDPDGSKVGGFPRSCTNGTTTAQVRSQGTDRVDISSTIGAPRTIILAAPFGTIDSSTFAGTAQPWIDYIFSLGGFNYKVCLYRSGRVEALGFSGSCN